MQRMVVLFLLTVSLLATQACQNQPAVAPIPGQINTFDGVTYRALMDAQAFLNSINAQVKAGTLTLNSMQTKMFNNITVEYNTAQAAWKVYHAGGVSDATTLQSAINQLSGDITQLAAIIGGGGK